MADDDHIPYREAAISVSCPCRRWATYYDAEDMRVFLISKRWPVSLATVRERFRCKECGGQPTTRIVGPLTKVTQLMPARPKRELGYESEVDRTPRRGRGEPPTR